MDAQPTPRPLREAGASQPAFASALAANPGVTALFAVVSTVALTLCMASLAAIAALRRGWRAREVDAERARVSRPPRARAQCSCAVSLSATLGARWWRVDRASDCNVSSTLTRGRRQAPGR